MASSVTSTVSRYGVALLAIAVAILLRAALTPWMGGTFPLATITTAVAFVVWYGGWGPALFTTLFGYVAAGLVFRAGRGFFGGIFTFNEAVGFLVYLLSCLSVIVLGVAMRAAQRRLEHQQQELTSTNLALENKVEAREVLAFAMQAGRMGAWRRDLRADTVWWSPELAAIYGLPSNDTNYTRDKLFSLVSPEDQLRLPKQIEAALAARQDYLLEFRFQHAQTGEWRWMEVRGRAQYDAGGRPILLHGLGIDITDRVRAVEALKEADRRKDEFLATLAHELRNPLAPISSGLHILRSAGADAAAAAMAREIMERQVAQMVRLVDDLLDVARITTGKVELRCEPIDIADAVRDALDTSRPLIDSGGQQLTVSLPSSPLYVNADRTRLAQVFANLLNNSAKFSDRGRPISIAVTRDDNTAVVRVRDHGAGITPEALPRVFDMFGQAEGGGARRSGGLGIGLSIVKRLIAMHGGSVEATSEGVARGSEFVVRIPALAEDSMTPRTETSTAAPAGVARRRILVVDDNADAAEALAAILAINGHDTRLAHDGVDAVKTAQAFQPDVVFLDIGMPAVDGHETARRIRQQPWGREMVLVALTGWGQSEDRRRSLEAGFNHHLVKPADPAVVEKLIASLS